MGPQPPPLVYVFSCLWLICLLMKEQTINEMKLYFDKITEAWIPLKFFSSYVSHFLVDIMIKSSCPYWNDVPGTQDIIFCKNFCWDFQQMIINISAGHTIKSFEGSGNNDNTVHIIAIQNKLMWVHTPCMVWVLQVGGFMEMLVIKFVKKDILTLNCVSGQLPFCKSHWVFHLASFLTLCNM